MSEFERLVTELESLPEDARESARALLEETLALHRQGLSRLLELGGAALREAAVRDALVSALLALHDLHPLSVEERARAALEQVRAELLASGASVELLSATNGLLRARVRGRGAEDARGMLTDLLWGAAPDAAGVEIEAIGPVLQLRVNP
jgi:hypothetical protein